MYFSTIFKKSLDVFLKASLILLLGFNLPILIIGNPIVPPPIMTEIYFGPGGWEIEMVVSEIYGMDNFDGLRVAGIYDTALIQSGITFTPGEVFYITQDDFITPLYIDQNGDLLRLQSFWDNQWWDLDWPHLAFGNVMWSQVSSPVGEESIAFQHFSCEYGDDYWTAKEIPNTIGYNPYQVNKRAQFYGYVFDKNDEPLSNIKLDYCMNYNYYLCSPELPVIYTNEDGYFFTDQMFCKFYDIVFLFNEEEIGESNVYIEPDSANYFEFRLDTLLSVVKEVKSGSPDYTIKNIPNPFSNTTTFVIDSRLSQKDQKGVIKIYSNEGIIVDIIPVELTGSGTEVTYSSNRRLLPSGVYYYNLEIGRHKEASGKMVFSR